MRTKNKIISGIVNEARHTFRISVNDSLYKAIKYHAAERKFTTAGAAEEKAATSAAFNLLKINPAPVKRNIDEAAFPNRLVNIITCVIIPDG